MSALAVNLESHQMLIINLLNYFQPILFVLLGYIWFNDTLRIQSIYLSFLLFFFLFLISSISSASAFITIINLICILNSSLLLSSPLLLLPYFSPLCSYCRIYFFLFTRYFQFFLSIFSFFFFFLLHFYLLLDCGFCSK